MIDKKEIESLVFQKSDVSFYFVNMALCRYRSFRGYHFYQCSRKYKVTIEGYNFCKQHAEMVRRHLDHMEEIT